jgi:hypothetical protein
MPARKVNAKVTAKRPVTKARSVKKSVGKPKSVKRPITKSKSVRKSVTKSKSVKKIARKTKKQVDASWDKLFVGTSTKSKTVPFKIFPEEKETKKKVTWNSAIKSASGPRIQYAKSPAPNKHVNSSEQDSIMKDLARLKKEIRQLRGGN